MHKTQVCRTALAAVSAIPALVQRRRRYEWIRITLRDECSANDHANCAVRGPLPDTVSLVPISR